MDFASAGVDLENIVMGLDLEMVIFREGVNLLRVKEVDSNWLLRSSWKVCLYEY